MATVYVSVGSNVRKDDNIRSAMHVLAREFGHLSISTVYQTQSVGFEGDDFYNLVMGFRTDLPPQELVILMRAMESDHGRVRGPDRYAPRTLDLDLLLYDDLVLSEAGLQIPSDEILRYAFVLCPLAEIASDVTHPRLGRTMSELWQAFDDPSQRLNPVDVELVST